MIKYIVYFIDPLKTKKPLVSERSTELTAKSCRREETFIFIVSITALDSENTSPSYARIIFINN